MKFRPKNIKLKTHQLKIKTKYKFFIIIKTNNIHTCPLTLDDGWGAELTLRVNEGID